MQVAHVRCYFLGMSRDSGEAHVAFNHGHVVCFRAIFLESGDFLQFSPPRTSTRTFRRSRAKRVSNYRTKQRMNFQRVTTESRRASESDGLACRDRYNRIICLIR